MPSMAVLTGGVHASEDVSFDREQVTLTTEGVDPGAVGIQVGPVFVLVDDAAGLLAALRRVVE